MLLVMIVFSQGNGETGAGFADTFRAILGPGITAQIESWYLGLGDTIHQIEYQLNGKQVAAPWTVGLTPTTGTLPRASTHPTSSRLASMALAQIPPMITPSIAGEGAWLTQEMAPSPYNYLPAVAKTFVRPDPSHPYAVVTLLQFDSRFMLLHMVAGTSEPGGSRGMPGPGVIPAADQNGNALLAAFNGGFKYADGQYGMKADGVVYVPPQPGAATIAVTKEGQMILGAWGVDPHLNSGNADLVAWRQNASLLIANGIINPLTQDGAAWGGTILNSAYTWRSGIGITAQGTLIYAAGNSLSAYTLATALRAAGAVMAMQTDINPYWVRAFLYKRDSQGALTITRLNPNMQGSGTEYLNGTARDFFYLTRVVPSSSPASNLHGQ
ncbi:MAG: phosphodiester glycosidase family protein [Ktedonobacteraceae bacterium]